MAVFKNYYNVDLGGKNFPRALDSMVCQDNVRGNQVGAYVYENGEAVALGGTCTGKVIRADGSTVALSGDGCVVSGNLLYVTLTSQCYEVPGLIEVIVNSVRYSTTTTIVKAFGTVERTTTDAVVPSANIPNLDQLLAQIEALQEATEDAQAIISMVADLYSSSSAYAVGDYCIHDGGFYKCTTAISSPGESWTSGHWTATNVGDEIALERTVRIMNDGITRSDIALEFNAGTAYTAGQYVINPDDGLLYRLTADHAVGTSWSNTSNIGVNVTGELNDKTTSLLSAIHDKADKFALDLYYTETSNYVTAWNQGWIRDNGSFGTSANNCRTDKFAIASELVTLSIKENYVYAFFEYSSSGTFISNHFRGKTEDYTFAPDSSHTYAIQIGKTDGGTLSVQDVPADVFLLTNIAITDTTLSKSKKPADAKAVGEQVKTLLNDDNYYEDRTQDGEYQLTFTNGKYINTSGGVGEHNSCSATLDYMPIRQGDVLSIQCQSPGQIDVIAVYDENKTLIETFTHSSGSGAMTYNVGQNGFIRLSNEPGTLSNSNCFLKVTNINNVGVLENRLSTVETIITDAVPYIPYEFNLTWTSGKYIIAGNGNIGNASTMACTEDYYPVKKDQKLEIYLYARYVNECAVAFYNESKVYDANEYVIADGKKIVVVPFDGFARFSTRTDQISTANAYVKNYTENDDSNISFGKKAYFVADNGKFVTDETALTFKASSPRLDYSHKGAVTPAKKFLAIGFDDFRTSDFDTIMPLFEKYGGKATFNRPITSNNDLTDPQKNLLNCCVFGGHEFGDHTIRHYAFPYEDALFNGQNPNSLDGTQTPYPTNEQMRGATGATYNAFHFDVATKVSEMHQDGLDSTIANTEWANLTDAQCQTIRETFSALKNPTLAPLLDEMSNYYLGTTGRSDGSWDSSTGKYTGGIFTGCATSANHEIWERIMTIMQMYYKEKYGLNWEIQCWSWPGNLYFGSGFSNDGQTKYYKPDLTLYYDMNARFESSLYTDELGNAKVRSFTDVLREFGYKYTHDYIYPGRRDGLAIPAMRRQFFLNEHLSKEDGILYPTNRTVSYSDVSTTYPETFFTTGKTKGAQMYDVSGAFRSFVEALRHDTAHGVIHGEVIDSTDSYSTKMFFEEALRFCKFAGIDVITKAEAYDICFNNPVEDGNLIYNPTFKNSAAEFFTDATNVPTNPDGYSGNCSVTADASGNILSTTGETVYLHYGVPLGKIRYSADAKGTGTITIYLIKCGNEENLTSLTQLTQISVSSGSSFAEVTQTAVVPDNPLTAWSQRLEGRDNKVLGLKIVYSTGLQIKNIKLEKV